MARQEWTWRRSLERLALARLGQAGDLAMATRVCKHTGAPAKTGSWCLFDPEPCKYIYTYTHIYTYIYICIHVYIHIYIYPSYDGTHSGVTNPKTSLSKTPLPVAGGRSCERRSARALAAAAPESTPGLFPQTPRNLRASVDSSIDIPNSEYTLNII